MDFLWIKASTSFWGRISVWGSFPFKEHFKLSTVIFYINTMALRTLPSCHLPCKQYKNRTSKPWFHSLLTSNSHCLWLHIMVCIFLSVSMYIPEILILRDIFLPFKCIHCNRYFSRKRCSAITAIFAAVLLSDALSVRKKL